MEGISLGTAFLRLYGDRSALDRELETLKRYTDQLEKRGISVKFDADTGKATREIDGLKNRLNGLNGILQQVGQGLRGDSGAWSGLAQALGGVGSAAGGSAGGLGQLSGALGGAVGMAGKALPVLGQLGLAAQGLQAIFYGVSGAVNSVLGPLQALAAEAGRFNQQVAEASIFTAQSFAILGPDGKAIEGTANQMRAVRGVITKEYKEIQKEVAKISGATASEIYEGFNLILQNSQALGTKGEDLAFMRKLSTRLAAGMNVLGIPGEQMRSEVQSLLTGDIQMYDQLAKKLGYDSQTVKQLQAEGRFGDDLMQRLQKIYEGQEILSKSLANVRSNYQEVFQTISTEGGQALERGLATSMAAVLRPLNALQGSFSGLMRSLSEGLEPLLGILGEIGGWLVPLSSILSSAVRPALDLIGVIASLAGTVPVFRMIGQILTIMAKGFELSAARVSALLRPLSTFFRVITQLQVQSEEGGFKAILDFFDGLIEKADAAAASIARPFIDFAKQIAWIQGKLNGLSDKEILQRQAQVEASFAADLGGGAEPELRSLKLSQETVRGLEEWKAQMGTGGQRQLNEAKNLSQLVQDRIKNEVQGLEQALKLMGAQKTLQEQLNQLAEGRRGLASSRAGFAVSLASSPEARLAAEESRNDLALRQEQERIQERRALLGTEREILQTQLQIQLRQQRLQEEQLKIQRLELVIQRDKAQNWVAEIRQRMMLLRSNTPEYQGLAREYREAGQALQYRRQQVAIIDRTLGLQREMVGVVQQTNAAEARGLDLKEQQLGVQSEMAALTREQQAQMAELQRREQDINNERDRALRGWQMLMDARDKQIRDLQYEERTQQKLQALAASRLELQKAQAAAATQAAEAELKVAQAQQQAAENPTSVRAVIGAQIEALAADTQGFVSEAEATRKLYDAKQRQLNLEQEMQRQQLELQQQRERSEQRIYELNLQRQLFEQMGIQARLQAEKDLIDLRGERDALSAAAAASMGSIPVGTWVGSGGDYQPAPAAPVLPPPAAQAAAQISPRQRALLDTIAYAEGTYNPNGYRTMFTGRLFGDLSRHPRQINRSGQLASDAAGRYQFLSTTWDMAARAIGARDFGPINQDTAALWLAQRRGVNTDAPLSREALARLAPEWASLPTMAGGSAYAGQGAKGADALLRFYSQRLATYGNGMAAGGGAQPITSNTNALEANTDALDRSIELSNQLIEQIKEQRDVLTPKLEEQLANARQGLTATQQAQQQALAVERNRAQLTAGILGTPRGRLAAQLTDAVAPTLGNSLRGVLQQAFQGEGFDLAGLAEGISRTMAERFTGALVDAALAPIEQAITKNLFRQFSGVDVEEQARLLTQQQAADGQQRAADTMQRAADTMLQAAQGEPTGGGAGSAGQASSLTAYTMQPLQMALSDSAEEFGRSMDGAAQTIDVVATTAGQTAGGFSQLMATLGRVGGVLGGIAMGVGGAQQMSRGGTYNTLMGLAGIFGSIGSIAGMFGGGGGAGGGGSLGGFNPGVYTMPMLTGVPGRAYGGRVTNNQAYKVGENGVELFIPSTAGTVIPNDQTRALLASRNALGGGAMGQAGGGGAAFDASRQALEHSDAIARERTIERVLATSLRAPTGPISYQSEVINRVEYVSADQFERGLRDAETRGAERGRALTLGALKNSVKTRRGIGL